MNLGVNVAHEAVEVDTLTLLDLCMVLYDEYDEIVIN